MGKATHQLLRLGGSLPLYALGVALWTVGEVVGFPVASALVSVLAPPGEYGADIAAGETLTAAALTIKRPGNGFPPAQRPSLIGRTARVAIPDHGEPARAAAAPCELSKDTATG